MRTLTGLLLVSLAVGLISSCSRIQRLSQGKPEPTPTEAFKVPSMFQRDGGRANAQVKVTLEDASQLTPESADRIRDREEDLMWTDPDNPERGLEGMEEVMAEGARRGPWLTSYSQARRAAMREGKPMLVWFTDTQFSPLCRFLDAEVFSKAPFKQWASGSVVRVRLDFNVKGRSGGPGRSAMDDRVRKENYLQALKERYRVLGLPTVLVMNPDGTVVSRYRGYKKSFFDFYLARLKNDAGRAVQLHRKWQDNMGRRGYREWKDARGRTVFAKLTQYREGDMILVEPDGKRLRARESNLSSADRAWIAAEKAKRDN
ncbi:MAG: thioredoxin family protein [Roseibacillus sp.]|nr:thioredoxin family protein [Roseibacillus sp.]MDP7306259.1 thioredoxin family protein [Roseibacillus sp.]MDP7657312.1 thioredoxin family protein [Roseibacillus sp.]HJM62072.1 thioredoxin family protein [Roseibacillus sp.]